MENQLHKTSGKKLIKLLFRIFMFGFGITVICLLIMGLTPPRIPVTPSGEKQMQSIYIPMEDGAKIAVRISLPPDLEEGQQIPTVIEATRYQTDIKTTFLSNIILKFTGDTKMNLKIGHPLIEAGYAYIRIDTRGSGASFGTREMELPKQEIEDIGEVIDWIISQPWSNGKVGTYGVSYSGNTAELALALNHPNLAATATLYSDFDPLAGNVMPGGIKNNFILENWSEAVANIDANMDKGLFSSGIAPVDEDKNGVLLNLALSERNNINIAQAFETVTYYDDLLTEDYTAHSLAPFYFKEEIQESGVPFYVRVGWLDAGTVDGAIERFLTYENNQQLVIGPWNHSGSRFYDPFLEVSDPGEPLAATQDRAVIAFFDRYLKGDEDNPQQKEISYYTMGEGVWKTTPVWPVDGFVETVLYFFPDGSMHEFIPEDTGGTNQYAIDFSATTGESNRWYTQLGAPPIFYPDRAEEDQKLLTYTSEPLENDIEITGNPVVTLNLSSTATDGAFYVYLEAVAPDGKVIYITEGQLRALHRNEASRDLDHIILGPKHSFERIDGQEMVPGENVELNIGLFATSVLIPKGYRLRIAIAGHDASTFERIPEVGNPVIELQVNGTLSSFAAIPMRVR